MPTGMTELPYLLSCLRPLSKSWLKGASYESCLISVYAYTIAIYKRRLSVNEIYNIFAPHSDGSEGFTVFCNISQWLHGATLSRRWAHRLYSPALYDMNKLCSAQAYKPNLYLFLTCRQSEWTCWLSSADFPHSADRMGWRATPQQAWWVPRRTPREGVVR